MPDTTTDPKTTIPRSAGKWRTVGRIQPGWWVHLEPNPGGPEGTPSGWEQVKTWFGPPRGPWRTIVFNCNVEQSGGNAITAHKDDTAVTLTEREAAKLGLVAP